MVARHDTKTAVQWQKASGSFLPCSHWLPPQLCLIHSGCRQQIDQWARGFSGHAPPAGPCHKSKHSSEAIDRPSVMCQNPDPPLPSLNRIALLRAPPSRLHLAGASRAIIHKDRIGGVSVWEHFSRPKVINLTFNSLKLTENNNNHFNRRRIKWLQLEFDTYCWWLWAFLLYQVQNNCLWVRCGDDGRHGGESFLNKMLVS